MTKTIVFDLHFTRDRIKPLTDSGREFMSKLNEPVASPVHYAAATAAGLHVTFETVGVRDWVTSLIYHKEEADGDISTSTDSR